MGFEFQTRTVELEICGKKYKVTTDNNTDKMCKDIKKRADEMIKRIQKDAESVTDDEVCDFFFENIDKLLGKGSSTAIFMGRKRNFIDAAQLFNYIIKELTADAVQNIKIFEDKNEHINRTFA